MLGHEGEEVGTAAAAVAVAVAGGELQQPGLAIHIAAPGSAASFLAGSRPVVNREKKIGQKLARVQEENFEKLQDCTADLSICWPGHWLPERPTIYVKYCGKQN